jgi:hypothetical protein
VNTAIAVSNQMMNLSPSTTYHYRLVATNAAGATFGADQAFTTQGFATNGVYVCFLLAARVGEA